MTADGAERYAAAGRWERAELSVIRPAIERADVESRGRVGAVAYPYRVYRATASLPRAFMSARDVDYVVSVDRSRRLAVRADVFPEIGERTLSDVLELPSELTDEQADEKARESVFQWALRKYSPNAAPEIEFDRVEEAYKLFWIVEREGGDVIVDSVRGTEEPFSE